MLIFSSAVLNVCTIGFNIVVLCIFPTQCIYVCHAILIINNDYFLKQQNRLVFVIEKKCLLCEVETEEFCIVYINCWFQKLK
jgi:hypothetical protein